MHDTTMKNSHTGHAAPGDVAQDGELMLFDADSIGELRNRVTRAAELTSGLPEDLLCPLAADFRRDLTGRPVRAAIVAGTAEQAAQRLAWLLATIDSGTRAMIDVASGSFLGEAVATPGIGLLFPGQDLVATEQAQPRVTLLSAADLRVMSRLGIEGTVAVGRGLGELTALYWAGAMTEAELFELAVERVSAAAGLDAYLDSRRFRPLTRRVVSAVTGDVLPADVDLRRLLVQPVCAPGRFGRALSRMAVGVSLLIEIGPGRSLSGLAAKITPGIPVIPFSTDGSSGTSLLNAAGAAYVLGAAVRHELLAGQPPAMTWPDGIDVAVPGERLSDLVGSGAAVGGWR
jgi:hypothetical protein